MNTSLFQSELTAAMFVALRRARVKFESETISCLAVDIHPWAGFLNLSMRVVGDERDVPWIADWKHSFFAEAHGSCNWPEAIQLCEFMKDCYKSLRESCPQGDDSKLCWPIFCWAARAVTDPLIWDALEGIRKTDPFLIYVGDPDELNAPLNYCNVVAGWRCVGDRLNAG